MTINLHVTSIQVKKLFKVKHICVHTHREYLGDTVGSVPNHHNKAGMTINKSNEFSDFLVHMKSYVYTIL